ncbi:hypothetical protein [Lentibacillus jeotgali]|uniref:hypothetical protein n=1 Tax=Lentibacillus jeotgali TaxID=558169 RepID=UPI00026283D0|nr:hypothetical protein [Lentibacillus jeotgali]
MSNNEFGKAIDKIQDKDVKQEEKAAIKDSAESSRKASSLLLQKISSTTNSETLTPLTFPSFFIFIFCQIIVVKYGELWYNVYNERFYGEATGRCISKK